MESLNCTKIFLFTVSVVFAGSVCPVNTAVAVTPPGQKMTEDQSHRIIDLAVGAIKNVANARGNLKQKKI